METRLRLYYAPGTRARRVRWFLEELEQPYELRTLQLRSGDHRTSTYRSVHPFGKVPALEIDGEVMTESLAICFYLADRFWEKDLAPVHEEYSRRAVYLTWMCRSVGTLEPALDEEARHAEARLNGNRLPPFSPALTPWDTVAAEFERVLSSRRFLMGEGFTASDVMNGSIMLAAREKNLVEGFPAINAWLDRLTGRAAFKRAAPSVAEPPSAP